MPQCSPGSLYRDPLRHEKLRPLFGCPIPFPLVLGCGRPLVGLDTESSEVVQKAPHPLLFLPPPEETVPSSSSPNITHFCSLVSSIRATNAANRIRLLRNVASMLSLPVFKRVST